MESNDITSKLKHLPVEQDSDEAIKNQLYKESLTCGSKPKIQLLELSENIQTATSNYDKFKMQWDIMKNQYCGDGYSKTESVVSQKSISSCNSLKISYSEHSIGREEPEENHEDDMKDQEENKIESMPTDNQVHVVLTPRTPVHDPQIIQRNIVPILDMKNEESLESVKTNKRGKRAKTKRKKFHGRLKNSNSKSTVATRETNFSDKKGDRRKFRRQKSLDTISVLKAPQQRKRGTPLKARESKQINSKDFVEIYHNNALKSGSLSIVSSRHSKITPMHVSHLHDEGQEIGDNKSKKDYLINEQSVEDEANIDAEHPKDEHFDDSQYQVQDQITTQSPDYLDPFYMKNYEMPTMASKLKRVNRPYFHRFNIRNIPFVVGTSISPSHNLGLNIQQVLSIIKIRQPTVPGISPLLIQKVSRGVQPVSSLFEHINSQYARSCRNLNCQDVTRGQRSNLAFNQDINSVSCEHLRTNNISSTNTSNQACFKQNITCEPLYEEDEESHSTCSMPNARSQILQRKPDDSINKSFASRQSNLAYSKQSKQYGQQLNENGVADLLAGSNNFNYSTNNKEMTEVFTRLYDQFQKMIIQHDKLKEQLEKRKDKALIKEISELEETIAAKEQEITAVVNLYKEVMSLKQQMKLLHERNSFVCIATEDPVFGAASRVVKSQARAHTVGSLVYGSRPKYSYGRRADSLSNTPNALRLAGLLKQIQAFQRQLVLA